MAAAVTCRGFDLGDAGGGHGGGFGFAGEGFEMRGRGFGRVFHQLQRGEIPVLWRFDRGRRGRHRGHSGLRGPSRRRVQPAARGWRARCRRPTRRLGGRRSARAGRFRWPLTVRLALTRPRGCRWIARCRTGPSRRRLRPRLLWRHADRASVSEERRDMGILKGFDFVAAQSHAFRAEFKT